jgi:endoglucanase
MAGVISTSAASAAADTTPRLHTQGSEILTETGEQFTIRAVNWFGLETSNCAPHGLWRISLDQAMDQMASFGFNTIRLPFSSECIAAPASAVSGVDTWRNPGLVGLTPLQIMDRVVDAAQARHLRVILDRHRPDSGSQSELWYTSRYPEQQWIADWVSLAKRYLGRPTVIGADLHNEPHGPACWGCGNPATDWAAAATRAGNAVLTANPDWLIVVEGVEQQATAGWTWWGGGLADAATHPITLSAPNRLVYSAHDYPASVYPQRWFADPGYPGNLPAIWDRNWGYLQRGGIAPVLLGEFGTKLETASDRAWLTTLVDYLGKNRIGFAYWSYNPNSGDTGGLVADDWVTPQRAKLDALAPLLPGAAGSTVSSRPPTSTSAAAQPSTTPPSTTAPSTFTVRTTTTAPTTSTTRSTTATRSTATRPTSTTPTTTTTRPTSTTPTTSTTRPTTPTATTSPGTGARATAVWKLRTTWPTGYVADIDVTAPAGAVTGWQLSWADPHARAVSSAWGMTCSVAAGRVSCTGAAWAATVPARSTVRVGLVVTGDGAPPTSPTVTIG